VAVPAAMYDMYDMYLGMIYTDSAESFDREANIINYYYYIITLIWPQPSGPSKYIFRSPSTGASLMFPLLAYQRLA
jgi:hypothetical protein